MKVEANLFQLFDSFVVFIYYFKTTTVKGDSLIRSSLFVP